MTLIEYIKTSIEVLMNMKSDEFAQANRKLEKRQKKAEKTLKCHICKKILEKKEQKLGSGRIQPESSRDDGGIAKIEDLMNDIKDVTNSSRSEVKIEVDDASSSRKFTLSYQRPLGPGADLDGSEVTSSATVPAKYEEQLQQYERELRLHI
jgi:hypothetical protein